jgi:hypothetical protein
MAGAAMTPGAHIEVLVRGEWIAVEVTHVPTEDAAAYLGRCRDGKQLAWTPDAEMRAGVGATIAERVEPYRPREADVLREQLDDAVDVIAWLEGRCAGLEMRAMLAEDERVAALHGEALSVAAFQRLLSRAELHYKAGRRDGMAVAAHKGELVRDVVEAAKAYANPALHGDAYMAAGRALEKALDVLIASERAKEG